MEKTFNLLQLIKFLHQTLLFMEKAKCALKSDCDEAMYCLKPWYLANSSPWESSTDHCTCLKFETEVEEIATGISRALIETQQLREELSLNIREKTSKCFNMYECSKEIVNKKQKRIKNLSTNKKNIYSIQDFNAKKSSNQKISVGKELQNKISQRDVHMKCEQTNNDDKQLVTHLVKLTESKNFLVINKKNIKNIKGAKKHKDINHKLESNTQSSSSTVESKYIKFGEKHSMASTSELKNLIQKVSTKSYNCTLSNERNMKCPLHGNLILQCNPEQNLISGTILECFKLTNIPEEIIKSLKVYHIYLNIELSEKLVNEKGQKAIHKFLEELNKMDNIIQKKLVHKDYITTLFFKFISLFQTLFSEDIEVFNLTNIKAIYAELSSSWKMYETKEFHSLKIFKHYMQETLQIISTTTKCATNGIWNFFCIKGFEEKPKICCIRYISTNQLLLFFNLKQQLQHTQYHKDLIKIIMKDVLPNMKMFNSTELEYIKIYKMIFILYQGLNPKIPVLVKTDNQKIEADIKSHAGYMNNYIQIDPATQGTQCSKIYSIHEVNTNTATFRDNGMYHSEGGWPKDLNTKDTEQTIRYKRKIEKDELYIHTMLQLLPPIEQCILQNNACNIYEQYFNYMEPVSLIQRIYSRTVNVYRDILPTKRQITHLSWSPDQGNRFAASYCNIDFKKAINENSQSYIWDVENPSAPCVIVKSFYPILTLEYNPKDSNILISGLLSGQVACWDIRKGSEPVDISLVEFSHRDLCNEVLWINSKTSTEFFSASKDGQIMWWDIRKLQTPTETLVIDLFKPDNQNVNKAIGISTLQFEPSMSTRFMCGLENGIVISGNRKGKTSSEKIATRFKAQYGPVISLERNPTFVKNFLTVGDWTTRIWSEDCKESCIAWTPGYRNFLMGGAWSATRFSVFFIIKMDGTLDVWDLLVQQDSPVLSVKICDEVLTYIKPHEQGQLAAIANKKGTTFLLEFSEALTTNQKNDKFLFTALLDRETRREKVIEAKNREQRLKMKSFRNTNFEIEYLPGNTNTDEKNSKDLNLNINDATLIHCEEDYENNIKAELLKEKSCNEIME